MSLFSHARLVRLPLLLCILTLLILTAATPYTRSAPAHGGHRLTVVDAEFLGIVTFPTGTLFADTEVGGLSGITYDVRHGVYYALSDDRSGINPARFYTVEIDLSDGYLDAGDVTFTDVTFLLDNTGETFARNAIDPEGIEWVRGRRLFISTEGDADSDPTIDPLIGRFNLLGRLKRANPVPHKFLPDGSETFGVRDNLAFESLTATPNQRFLYTATENALVQDGPPSTLTDSSPSRLLEYSRFGWPLREFVYMVNPIPRDSDPPGIFADNGLVELETLDNRGTFLAMERSFAVGVGNTVVLYETSTHGAMNVAGFPSLQALPFPVHTMDKRLVADFETDLGIRPDNLEGMTFGPPLPDGRLPLIVVSDNNFNPGQITQFIAVAIELAPASGR